MNARAQLIVRDDMVFTISITLTIMEIRGLLKELRDEYRWPVPALRSVLSQTLSGISAQVEADHEYRCP